MLTSVCRNHACLPTRPSAEVYAERHDAASRLMNLHHLGRSVGLPWHGQTRTEANAPNSRLRSAEASEPTRPRATPFMVGTADERGASEATDLQPAV